MTVTDALATLEALGDEAGNVEAQLLATLIVTPTLLSADQIDAWTRSTTCAQVAEWMNASVVAQHPEKESLRQVDEGEGSLGGAGGLAPDGQPREQGRRRPRRHRPARSHREGAAEGRPGRLYRDWPVSKGCTPPYVPVWVEAMVKRQA